MFKVRKWLRLVLIASVFAIAVAGCQPPKPTQSPLSPLPSPVSPLETTSLLETSAPFAGKFSLNTPLIEGATVVSGTGPAGTPIFIVDLTLMARPLGSAFIGKDGTFEIQVDPPLVAGRLIGIQLGKETGKTVPPDYEQRFLPYKGNHARNIPQLGLFWDTATVEPAR